MHAASNVLSKSIMVYDDRERAENKPGVLFHYKPGYETQVVVKKKKAAELKAEDPDMLWVHLTPGHFSAMCCR